MRVFLSRYARYILLAAAAASFAYGIWRGELGAVLRKATVICLECIGIG